MNETMTTQLARVLGLALAYWGVAHLIGGLAAPPGFAVPIWPSAGIALGALVTWGPRVWPGILIGSFLFNLATTRAVHEPIDPMWALAIPLGIATGATLQGLLGRVLVRRFVGASGGLEDPREIIRFLVIGGPVSCLVNASLSVVLLVGSGVVPIHQSAINWLTWWAGDTMGVVIFAPLFLTLFGNPKHAWTPRRKTVMLPLLLCLAAATVLFAVLQHWEARQRQVELALEGDALARALTRELEHHLMIGQTVANLYAANPDVASAVARKFLQSAFEQNDGAQAIFWVPRVTLARREAYEQEARTEGPGDYQIRELAVEGTLVRAGERAEYFPVRTIEPRERNARAQGLDIASDEASALALARARDSGLQVVTSPIRWLRHESSRSHFLLLTPVYTNLDPQSTPEQRRAHLIGFVAAVFRANDVVDSAFQGIPDKSLYLRLFDRAPGEERTLLYSSPRADEHAGEKNNGRHTTEILVGGRSWDAEFIPIAPHNPLRVLEEGLNDMAAKIEESQAELERRVEQATAELRAKKEESEAATLAKSRVLAYASHDLRQSLHALELFVSHLRQMPLNYETAKIVSDVDSCVQTLAGLLDGLLDLSRLDSGLIQPDLRPVPVSELWQRMHDAFAETAAAKHLELRFRPSPLWLVTDVQLLNRILLNLVSNAIRYTRTGGVLVACRRAGQHARLQVWDTGAGISPEHREEIFKEFVQLDNAERDRTKGLGLGLAIVERAARVLDHRLSVRSVPGRGSCFSLDVPIANADALVTAPAEAPSTVESFGFAGFAVLVVEDDLMARRALVDLLRSWHCAVVEAGTAEEAQRLLAEGCRPDVIASDFRLPNRQSGIDLVGRARAILGNDMAAFIISGDTHAEVMAAAKAAGLALLHKPVQAARLRRVMQLLLQESRLTQV